LKLVVDDGAAAAAPPAPPPPAPPASAPAPVQATPTSASEPQHDDEDIIDVHELEDAPAPHASSVDRVAAAFPGAELVAEEEA
jgi:hypothetical protein